MKQPTKSQTKTCKDCGKEFDTVWSQDRCNSCTKKRMS